MRRAGFTLIEVFVVVGIIVVMLAGAVMSVSSGQGAVRVKEATRGVIQLSRYASALALLRQRPVVVTFHRSGRIEVRISGETPGSGESGHPSDPIYLEVNGEMTVSAAEMAGEEASEDGEDSPGQVSATARSDGEKGFFYTRQVLDPDELAREDAEGEYEGVEFTVEVLDEEGNVLSPELAAARSLKRPERKKSAVEVFNSLDLNAGDEEDGGKEEGDVDGEPVSVTYETNGSVNPHRIIIRMKDASESDEGFAINVSRTGKTTVGDDDDEDRGQGRRRNGRRR